mgnify:CR=1 FL=1
MGKIYIHYGHKHFDPNSFVEIKNTMWNKPAGGLWASDINAKYGWKSWCEDENFCECNKENSFCFKLKEKSRILTINSHNDLFQLPLESGVHEYINRLCLCIDFEKLAREYDAIELLLSEDRRLYYDLYGWDCDSILILNKDCIEEIRG